ncbi:related to Target of rapamycin complex 2 subunit AVO1 [Zygosaccharomyces bailii ISA1307]|nr:related to Target of rapamycin complex 2 subunit AVO1 [Zygosaccharomyces bailii ISA1307]
MDTETSINRLRAQFLAECPDKDLMRRIIRPYCPGHDILQPKDVDLSIRKLYVTPEGLDIFPDLDSPPMSRNYMDSYVSTTRKALDKSKALSKSHENSDSEVDIENYKQEHENEKEKHLEIEKTMTVTRDSSELNENILPMPMLSESNKEINEGQDDMIEASISDSDSDSDSTSTSKDSRKRNNRKLPFSRIFKGKKENPDTTRKSTNKKKPSISSQGITKHSAFDINFGYDHGLEEDDEDEDEDEDDDGSDLHSQFFQLDAEASKTSNSNEAAENELQPNKPSSNNSLSYINNNSSNTNVAGKDVPKKKSHFPQNMIPRPTLLEGGKNSSKSEKILKAGGHDDYLGTSAAPLEGNTTEDQAEDISDIESYINEQDLDNLNLDATPPAHSKSINSKNELGMSSHKDNENSRSLEGSENMIEDCKNSDVVSSYGKSLLDSDFSGDNVFKPSESALDDNSMLDDSDLQPDTVSHSIPLSLDDYGIYHGQDDTTLDTAFDKAVLNIKGLKPLHGKERRSFGRPVSRSASKYSNSSNAKQREHLNSLTTASGESSKVLKHEDSRPQLHGIADSKSERPITPASPLPNSKSHSKGDWLTIEKTADFDKPKPHNSQLSSLFKKKINPSESSKDLLEYFSFISGNKVPRPEATELNVYIQASKTFRKKPFKLKVRKSANVFEVIGFILYHYAAELEEKNLKDDGPKKEELENPNRFCLKIVDEDGAPFEDNFGKLDRKKLIQTLSDNEVVLCGVSDEEMAENERTTPLPFIGGNEIIDGVESSDKQVNPGGINQLSYYRPIVGQSDAKDVAGDSKSIEIKVYIYPNTNKKFNYTNISVTVTSSVNDILVRYCKMKHMDPNEYLLKIPDKKLALNLNDTILRLDGHYEVEIISKREARELGLEKLKPDTKKPNLPTIQSDDLTPLTLEPAAGYLKPEKIEKVEKDNQNTGHKPLSKKKLSAKHKLGIANQSSTSSSNNSVPVGNGFFKSKNNSKTSLHGSLSYYAPNRPLLAASGVAAGLTDNGYQDLFSGAYHRYRVWRRQQMSLMNKHERTLALDGDYIYIVPPENYLHWHENVKTKSLHISQVILCKKSKRVPEYFKIFFRRGQDEIKRYYFEAVSSEECTEIVSRIQNLVSAYRMNHK